MIKVLHFVDRKDEQDKMNMNRQEIHWFYELRRVPTGEINLK